MSKGSIFMWRHARAALVVAALAAAGACGGSDSGGGFQRGSPPPTTLPALALERAFPALTFAAPVAMVQAPNDPNRWYVLERGGCVVTFPNSDSAGPADVDQVICLADVNTAGEGGLLGIAFHPDFPLFPHVFLSFTRTGPDPQQRPLTSVIARFQTSDGGLTFDPLSRLEILTVDQPFTNHNGGHIAFDGAGHLFIGLGDGGGSNDPFDNAQNVNSLLGKMLRIDIDNPTGGNNYGIPIDNPFSAGPGADEVYALGLRNPWRWSFDRATDRLWLGDVGQGLWEEVDIIERAGNYGWDICEGAHRRGSTAPCNDPAFIDPIAEYDHAEGRCSITGGYVYRGASIAALRGDYLFGDFCSGTIWGLREVPGNAPIVEPVIDSGLALVSFGESLSGELYVIDVTAGTLHRIVAAP